MPRMSRIRRRLTIAMLVTAIIPVGVAIWLASKIIRDTSARFFVPEVGARLEYFKAEADEESARYSFKIECRAELSDTAKRELLAAVDRHLAELNIEYAEKRKSEGVRERGKNIFPHL